MDALFLSLAVTIILAAASGILFKVLKQPPIIGYILAGIILGSYLSVFKDVESLNLFSTIGISLLLFLVGLNLNLNILRKLGFVSLITGIGQVLFTTIIGFFIAKSLGFSTISSLYISLALSFSSTIIIVKLLSDKNDLDSLYGRISIGFLLVQDLIAVFVLMFLSGLKSEFAFSLVYITILKGILLILILFLASKFILKKLFEFVSDSSELLFLLGITWCFTAAVFSSYLGFSIEIGAFLAGITLSFLTYNSEIISRISPLRDFFIIIFFVVLGLNMQLESIASLSIPVLVLSLFILIGNPLILLIIMGFLRYTKRTSFLAGLTVAQISEFSLILVGVGYSLGHLDKNVLSLVTLVGLITIASSTYMILNGQWLYEKLSPFLSFFERKKIRNEESSSLSKKNYDIVILGAHRTSYYLIKKLKKENKNFLVVDFDPEQIEKLSKDSISVLFGDISDSEIIEKIKSFSPKIIISTIQVYEDNLLLLELFKKYNKNILFITVANNLNDFFSLHKKGADMVFLPEVMVGHKLVDYLSNPGKIKQLGKEFYENIIKDKDKVILN